METQAYNTPEPVLTAHALTRMNERHIPVNAVQAALRHGRVFHIRGAEVHAIGQKDVLRYRQHGVDLAAYEGVQIVCAPDGRTVLTVYRNRDFRGLRPRHRRMAPARRMKRAIGVGN